MAGPLSLYQCRLPRRELRLAGGNRSLLGEAGGRWRRDQRLRLVRDKFGLPWQIVPGQIWDWLNGDDPAMVQRVTSKVWAMEKLDMAELQRAAEAED